MLYLYHILSKKFSIYKVTLSRLFTPTKNKKRPSPRLGSGSIGESPTPQEEKKKTFFHDRGERSRAMRAAVTLRIAV